MQWGISLCIFCAFFVVETYCTECPREAGFCVTSSNRDINNGVFKVNGDNVKSAAAKEECLSRCLQYDRSTGCEVIWDQTNRGCYIHTSTTVNRGNNKRNHECWVLKKCKNVCSPYCSRYSRCRRSKCECLQGYQGNGTFCEKSPQYSRCGGTINKSNANIRYHDSGKYRNNEVCTWDIAIFEPIIIKFDWFHLMRPCTQDLLTIQDLNGTVLKLFGTTNGCGTPRKLSRNNMKFTITNNIPVRDYIPPDMQRFRLIFKTNAFHVGRGFGLYIVRRTCHNIGCHALATCHVAPPHNAPHCKCDPGHWGDGRFSCRVHDACSRNDIFCHLSASCRQRVNTSIAEGSKRVVNYCKCNTGWSGNGTYCVEDPKRQETWSTASYFGIAFGVFVFCCVCCGGNRHRGSSNNQTATTAAAASAPHPQVARSQTPPPTLQANTTPTLQRSSSMPTISAGVTSEQEPILELSDLTNINDPPPAYQTFYDNHGADADALPPPPSYEEATSQM